MPLSKKYSRRSDAAAVGIKRTIAEAMRSQMKHSNTSIAAVAEKLGTGRTSVRRILDKENTSITLSTLTRAADAVGLKLEIVAKRMSPAELDRLASQLPGADATTARRLEDQIVAGFYGKKIRA